MRILLIDPPFHRLRNFPSTFLPLSINSLAAYVNKTGRTVRTYNADNPSPAEMKNITRITSVVSDELFRRNLEAEDFVAWREIAEVIGDFKPDLVGLSVMTGKYGSAVKVSNIVKQVCPASVVVWGGPHCSVDGVNALTDNDCIDYAISNEGEVAFERLITALGDGSDVSSIDNLIYRRNGNVTANPPGPFIEDLDQLPYAARDLEIFPDRVYHPSLGMLMASRGCPFKCAFCDSNKVWGRKVRMRSAENIVGEIKEINQQFGVTNFHFHDDTFTVDNKKTIAFCDELVRSGLGVGWSCNTRLDVLSDDLLSAMKRSGVMYVSCGIESGSDKILKLMRKGLTCEKIKKGIALLNKYSIDWNAFFMVGLPWETPGDIEMTRMLWREVKPSKITLSIFTPSPGSDLYDETKAMGLLPDNLDWSNYSWQSTNNYFIKDITKDEFERIVADMYREVNAINKSLSNNIRSAYRRKHYYIKHLPEMIGRAIAILRR